MFDLSKIRFIKNDDDHGRRNYSFVGIQRSRQNEDQLEFWLPLGFKDFDETNFEQVKGFFFKMYRTFKTYLQKKQASLNDEDITIDRDGIIEKESGFSFINENKEQSVFYGKLNSLEKILEGYDELRISSLEKKLVRSHELDYSKLHRYLHQAIYLDDDVIYLDEMNIAKNIIIKGSPPILQLFCFIYVEIKAELGEIETVPTRAIELADEFKEEHLQLDSQLFDEKTFAETLETLKNRFDEIDQETIYKDDDYWHFFDAIEAFLYGERHQDNEGIYWGFSSFYDIWEDMCKTYVVNEVRFKDRIVYFEDNGALVASEFYRDLLNPFEIRVNSLSSVRKLRPDLVLEPSAKNIESLFYSKEIIKDWQPARSVVFQDYHNLRNSYPKIYNAYKRLVQTEKHFYLREKKFFFMYEDDYRKFREIVSQELEELYTSSPYQVVDYKYMRVSDYEYFSPFHLNEQGENKVKDDIHKQLVYEWTLQKNWDVPTQSEFWIPYYSNDVTVFGEVVPITNTYFNQSQIKVVQVNFKTLQEFYIKQTLA
ncbi:hypothetical protein [Haliscomenobacter hydrossis]|uniref:Uncharacterized protein n=1 Tax=Haliscomenobacter hydrossis (strain ATCC 27775 / DSM 1100 / LMG 10767 / O) TaxID=760192 RepID=F4L5B7_HALH1|nr:hypothetical protein [Haliscomenobacter hydrossis]AEE49797.1 hypothetical protein Halhy_1912 [Haliscomenobacter hydrossis DSM 1100]